jgi:transcriptional regulator GlxA family with amidase domain
MAVKTIRVALLGFDGVQTLDLVGPLDAFSSANEQKPGAYAPIIVGLDERPFTSEAGLRMVPDCALSDAGPIDTLILPGGAGLRRLGLATEIATAVRERAPTLRRILSICTGIYALAPTGLLDGRRATTHWRYALDVARRFPAVRVDPDAIYIKDGPIYTSAGITAAIDLSLAIIDEDHGPDVALEVARDLVVYLKRSGGQRQYSAPLRFQARAGDRFAALAAWIPDHLDADLSVGSLASRVRLSPRQFTRRFGEVFGSTPAQAVEILRLEAARERLTSSSSVLGRIGASVGFASTDAFRRAFTRRFGIAPVEYRERFHSSPSTPSGASHASTASPHLPGPAARRAGRSHESDRGPELHRGRRSAPA